MPSPLITYYTAPLNNFYVITGPISKSAAALTRWTASLKQIPAQ